MQRSMLVKFHAGLLLTSFSFSSESESFSVEFNFLQPQGILQARILEWVAFPFSRGSFWPRNWTRVSCIAGRFFANWAIREALSVSRWIFNSTLARSHFVSTCRVKCCSTEHSFTITVLLISLYVGYLKKELVFRNFTNCDCEYKYLLNRLNFFLSLSLWEDFGESDRCLLKGKYYYYFCKLFILYWCITNFYLESSMDRWAWQATIHGFSKTQTWLSDKHFFFQSWLTMLWPFQVYGEGIQPHIHMRSFSPKLPSHPGCHIALSRIPCAIQ